MILFNHYKNYGIEYSSLGGITRIMSPTGCSILKEIKGKARMEGEREAKEFIDQFDLIEQALKAALQAEQDQAEQDPQTIEIFS